MARRPPDRAPGTPAPAPGPNRWLAAGGRRGEDYDRQFAELAAAGHDVHGEADFVSGLDAASVLDAGCGTGRIAVELARRGYDVVGVDLDEAMLAAARRKAPQLGWVHADLVEVDLGRIFDVVVLAGNVLLFVAPGTEGPVLANMARHLVPGGLLVAGFSLGPPGTGDGLDLATYDSLAAEVGLRPVGRWATWDRQPFGPGGDYAVSVHRRTA